MVIYNYSNSSGEFFNISGTTNNSINYYDTYNINTKGVVNSIIKKIVIKDRGELSKKNVIEDMFDDLIDEI